jgi:hypothetical protein
MARAANLETISQRGCEPERHVIKYRLSNATCLGTPAPEVVDG